MAHSPIPTPCKDLWQEHLQEMSKIVILTGAGISAESGIPTFRGKDGYWTVGSAVYHPQEMATHAMFLRQPYEVWRWYLYRLSVCSKAQPNAGHRALVELEKQLQDRFALVTQNVDGLHLEAGNSKERTYEIHGNIRYMRSANEETGALSPLPKECWDVDTNSKLPESIMQLLQCPQGGLMRPHVLWFDEYYSEQLFRSESALSVAADADLLLVVGTSGATTLPNHIVQTVISQGGKVIDVNLERNVFSDLAEQYGGFFLQGPSGSILPELFQLN